MARDSGLYLWRVSVLSVLDTARFAYVTLPNLVLVSSRGQLRNYAFRYSALACLRTGMSGSAVFQLLRKAS